MNHATEENTSDIHSFIFDCSMDELTENMIAQHAVTGNYVDSKSCSSIFPENIELNHGTFTNHSDVLDFPEVNVNQIENQLVVSCACSEERKNFANTSNLC